MILLRISILESSPPKGMKRAYKRIGREAFHLIGKHWQEKILPKHFTERARSRYGHQERQAKYRTRKRRMAERGQRTREGKPIDQGGRVDNVYTGDMRRMLESPAAIKAFPSRVTLRMTGPRYITMRPYKIAQPNKAAEITTVTPDERETLFQLAEDHITQELSAYSQPVRHNF